MDRLDRELFNFWDPRYKLSYPVWPKKGMTAIIMTIIHSIARSIAVWR
jgi:hypothetical protein